MKPHATVPARAILLSTALAALSGIAFADPNPAPVHPELAPFYTQFGQKPGLARIADDFLANLLADPRTHRFFADIDQEHFKAELVDQFCAILGGPCTYTGRGMRESHKGHSIHEAEFYATVEDLQRAMEKNHVPFRAQNKLLAVLAPMHREIVNKP